MSSAESPGLLLRIVAKVRALLPGDWGGAPGQDFRSGVQDVADRLVEKGKEYQVDEHARDLAQLGWKKVEGSLTHEHSQALLNYALAEEKKIELTLKQRLLEAKLRQEESLARESESKAREQEIREMQARFQLAEIMRLHGLLPQWDGKGTIRILKVDDETSPLFGLGLETLQPESSTGQAPPETLP